MKNSRFLLGATLSLGLGSASFAQGVPVIDATSLANQKEQFAQEIAQLVKEYEQAKEMYEAVNGVTDMDDIADLLNDPDVREILGSDAQDIAAAFDVNLDALGDLSGTAQSVYDFASLSGDNISADDFYHSELERIQKQSGRDVALGERIMNLSDDRLEGLEELRMEIGKVETQKEVDALNARIAVEQAMLQNDTVRVQGMAMLQEAQLKAEEQRQLEVAAERRELERAAISDTYGSDGF